MTLPMTVDTPLVKTRLPLLPSKKCGVCAADTSTPTTPSDSHPKDAPNVNFLLPLLESSVRKLVEPPSVVPTNGVSSQSADARLGAARNASDRIHARKGRPHPRTGHRTESLINSR